MHTTEAVELVDPKSENQLSGELPLILEGVGPPEPAIGAVGEPKLKSPNAAIVCSGLMRGEQM